MPAHEHEEIKCPLGSWFFPSTMGSRDKAQVQELEGLPEHLRDGPACKGAGSTSLTNLNLNSRLQ